MQATLLPNITLKQRPQAIRVEIQEPAIILSLHARNEAAFEQVFKMYFKALHAYASTILKDEMLGEEIVQNIFLKIWERKEQLSIQSSLKAYLYRAVHNESMNVLKHEKIKASYQVYIARAMKNETDMANKKILSSDLEHKLRKALNELPEQCRTIFQMSRFEELKYQEIADKLGLSIKTIENQMGKALKLLRLKLVDFLPLLLISLLHL